MCYSAKTFLIFERHLSSRPGVAYISHHLKPTVRRITLVSLKPQKRSFTKSNQESTVQHRPTISLAICTSHRKPKYGSRRAPLRPRPLLHALILRGPFSVRPFHRFPILLRSHHPPATTSSLGLHPSPPLRRHRPQSPPSRRPPPPPAHLRRIVRRRLPLRPWLSLCVFRNSCGHCSGAVCGAEDLAF